MKIVGIDDPDVVNKCIKVLQSGGVVMHPTETCYGLAVDISNEEALKKLYRIKGRDSVKPVSILVDSLGMGEELGIFSEKALELAHMYWPGPLSIVVPRKRVLPEALNPGQDFVSIRHSSHDFSTKMVEEFGGAITTTSANLAGMPALYTCEVDELGDLGEEIDLVVDGGVILQNQPSTVVKVDGDFIEVLRQGEILCE